MYINKIDSLLDKIIDDFYNRVIISNTGSGKEFQKILNEPNFIKFQPQINSLLINYTESINEKDISSIINNQDAIVSVTDMLKRYINYYFFLMIGFFYKTKPETFINNIIEFSKNQPSFKYKSANFFNSESNSNIIKYSGMIKNILIILDADSKKIEHLHTKEDFKPTFKFLSEFNKEFISANFKLKNIGGNKTLQAHNIIKTVLLTELYYKHEKKDVSQLLFSTEKEQGTYIFIDIVVPNKDYIDFNMIENVLSQEDIDSGLAYDIYDLIITNEDVEQTLELTYEDKIVKLITNKLVVPVVEDFLLYHKDSEKYERIDSTERSRKKEDIKIKYVVTKIEKASDLYSESVQNNKTIKESTEKLFDKQMSDRNAVIINNSEDIKIITKLMLQGGRVIENNEYYNDLIGYRKYPYINFKDFKKEGFSINLTNIQNPIDAIRNVSFTDSSQKFTKDKYNQIRIGSRNQTLNMIGIVIPTNKVHLYCIETDNIKNIREFEFFKDSKDIKSKYSLDNGYKGINKFIKHTLFRRDKWPASVIWLFDSNKDKVNLEKYEQTVKTNLQENMKLTVSKVYDDILEMMFIKVTNKLAKRKSVSFYEFDKIVRHVEHKYMPFPKESDLYIKLKKVLFFERYKKTKKEYDHSEDEFPGLFGDVIKMPTYKKKQAEDIPLITIKLVDKNKKDSDVGEDEEIDDIITYNAICEHNHTWDTINAMRKKYPNKFNKLLFEFIYQYVVTNTNDDYICKSCGTEINLKNYVRDGVYDSDNKFISYSTAMSTPLEEVPEYEKYNASIRSIDKMIDRLSSVSNIPMFSGATMEIKSRRKEITKNTIDLLIIHNKNMKIFYKERSNKLQDLYGINKSVTNLFVFELENSIFSYSTKDKDYYKPIKQNNVLVYILFFILIELNDTQILNMIGDKTCNFYWFEKYGYAMFDNLKIVVNNKNNTEPIQNYKVLCYLLYYISCAITKYSMWFYETDTKDKDKDKPIVLTKKKKFNPMIQKIIVNTTVDFINSILEMYSLKKHNYLYTVFASRFFNKLKTTFADKREDQTSYNIIDKLQKIENSKIVIQDGKKKYIVTKIKSIYLTKFTLDSHSSYSGVIDYLKKCGLAKIFLTVRNINRPKYYNINNMLACESGTFHNWEVKGTNFVCTICNKNADTQVFNAKESEKVLENYVYNRIKKYAEKYCLSGKLHTFISNSGINCSICSKCNLVDINKLENKDLNILQDNILKLKDNQQLKIKYRLDKQNEKIDKKLNYYKSYTKELKLEFNKSKVHKEDYYGYLNKFINHLEAVIGKDVNINSNNNYLRYDTYIINHDHNGYLKDNNIIIVNRDNKIKFKKNDPFFKRDVLFYTNFKVGRIDVYYDSTTYLLLGYKEPNTDYTSAKLSGRHLTVNYSLINKLKMLGYPSNYINIKDRLKKIRKYIKRTDKSQIQEEEMNQIIIKQLITEISHDRIINLKKTISDIQRYVNRLKYSFEEPVHESKNALVKEKYQDKYQNKYQDQDKSVFKKSNLKSNFMDKYKNKLKKIKLKDNQSKFFKDWKAVYYNLFFKNIKDKTVNIDFKDIDNNKIYYSDVADNDYQGNLILYYIVEELDNLIKYNHERFEKINTVFLIIDIINNAHNSFNIEDQLTNFQLKRFDYLLKSKGYVYDIEEKGHGLEDKFVNEDDDKFVDVDEIINEDEVNKQIDDIEESDAVDYTYDENDYEIDYEPGTNI